MDEKYQEYEKKFLMGPIDTPDEAMVILHQLNRRRALKVPIEKIDIDEALEFMKDERSELIFGAVDTPKEIGIFLKYLRLHGILQPPVDTLEEVQLFIKQLEQQGFFSNTINRASAFKPPSLTPQPVAVKRKHPKPKPYDDDIEEDEGEEKKY